MLVGKVRAVEPTRTTLGENKVRATGVIADGAVDGVETSAEQVVGPLRGRGAVLLTGSEYDDDIDG